jgi:FolB domain-containing protein
MDTIRISRLELSCIVGVRPAERRRRQRIALSIELDLDLGRAGKSGRIGHTVDYSVVADEVSFLLEFREYRLIEMATEEIAAMILGLHSGVERARVTLEKPEALRGRAAHAAVTISRSRSEPTATRLAYGEARLLLETAEARLEVIGIDPERTFDASARPYAKTLAWLASGHLEAGSPIAAHDPSEATRIFGARNPGPERSSVFLCTLASH